MKKLVSMIVALAAFTMVHKAHADIHCSLKLNGVDISHEYLDVTENHPDRDLEEESEHLLAKVECATISCEEGLWFEVTYLPWQNYFYIALPKAPAGWNFSGNDNYLRAHNGTQVYVATCRISSGT